MVANDNRYIDENTIYDVTLGWFLEQLKPDTVILLSTEDGQRVLYNGFAGDYLEMEMYHKDKYYRRVIEAYFHPGREENEGGYLRSGLSIVIEGRENGRL